MPNTKLILFLSTGLIVSVVLLAIALSVLFIMWIFQKEANRRQKHLRKRALDILVAYSHDYYVPLNASIAQVYSAIAEYRMNPSHTSAFKTFYYYCCYLYHEERLFASGVPLPFAQGEERNSFLDYIQKTLLLPGISEAQQNGCVLALTSLSIPCHIQENFEQCKKVLYNRLAELKSFETFLSQSDKLKALYEAFYKLYELLSHEIDHLFTISHIQSPSELIVQTLRDLWSEIRKLRIIDKLPSELGLKREVTTMRLVYALTATITGIVYVSVFVPLSYHSAMSICLKPIDVLLFAEMGPRLQEAFKVNLFPHFSGAEAQPTLFSMGASIGALLLGAGIALIADPVRVGHSTRGLIVTIGVMNLIGYILGTLPFDSVTIRLFIFKLAYLFTIFMVTSSLPDLFGRKGLRRVKYERLFNGLYGIAAGWILSKGFGPLATIYNSVLFFVSWFIVMAVLEMVYTHDPRFSIASLLERGTLNDFGKQAWAERRKVFPLTAILVVCTMLFHLLVSGLYWGMLAGRF